MSRAVVRPSSSNWASPIHLVKKGLNEWRIVDDYRQLNNITIEDRYPVPYLNDFQNSLYGMSWYSKLDLKAAFQQIPMHPDTISKTDICTPFELFEYLYMPFGLCYAAQTQQRLMDEVFRGLSFVFT